MIACNDGRMPADNNDENQPLKVVDSYCTRCRGYKNHKITAFEAEADSDPDPPVSFSVTFDATGTVSALGWL